MNKPKISIIIPIYNTELYLRDALQSVTLQTLEEIEIICVNDGSTDHSVEIVREYKDPRIRLIHHKKNKGLLMARKTGVKEARGEYCIFLDSDDELVPECCETIYNLIREYETDILCFTFQIIEDRNTSNKSDSYFRSVIMPDPSGKTRHVMRYMLSGIWYGTTIFNKIYRTALLKTAYNAMDSFSCVMGEDVYSSFYIAYYARSLKSVETEPLYIYHYGSGVSTKNVITLQEFQGACNMGNLSRRIKRFLIKEEAWRHCKRYWKAITKRLWEESCKSHILRVVKGYENDSITMLLDSWGGIMTDRDLCIQLIKELRKSKEQERRAKELSDWYLERIAIGRDSASLADVTLKSFEEGGIGMKYILKYAKAWAGYKLRNNSICPIYPSSGEQKKRIKKIRYKAKLVFSSDQLKCKCPCCGMRFPSFVAGDYINHTEIINPDRYIHTRQEVLCPECQSLPRHRILASWLNEHLVQPATIIYFAEEHCMDLWMNYNGINCITADLEQPANLKIDIQKTGLKRDCFDMIICNHVLEHVDDFRVALRELYRILKPGGRLICSFPMDPRIEFLDEDPDVIDREERRLRFGQYDHKRVFGMHADVFLKEAGFKVEKIKGEDYPDEILPVVGPADYDMNCLFCCTKMKEPNVEKS